MRMMIFVSAALICSLPGGTHAQQRTRLPQGPAGTVTLPVVDYDRLIDRAAHPARRTAAPPIPAVVARGDLRARVGTDTARGSLRLEGEIFERGHVKVPLVSGATLVEARADGRVLPLLQEGDAHAAVLPGPGPFSVTLDWAVPLSTAPGRASFALPASMGGTGTATIDLPGDPADVRVDSGIITRRQTANGRTTIELTLEPRRRAQVSWSVRETAPVSTAVEARTLADVKSLVTIADNDVRLVSLIDITVVRGEPRTFEIQVPQGYEVASISGTSLDTSDTRDRTVTLRVRDVSRRRHQFLINLERTHDGGSFKVDTSFPIVAGAQREVGETAIEAGGTIEVNASGDAGMRRMDVRETHASLRALARQPLLAAFRYQRRLDETRTLSVDVKRFESAPVIAAAAERAVATTLVTVEGRMLTEVRVTLRNRAHPYMKVNLPPSATLLSAELAGETVKPAVDADGTRVPLLRPGFKADGPYTVAFVYLHAGQAFAKRGEAQMLLPAIDVPINVLEWELFLPDNYSAKPLTGNVIPASMIDATGETAPPVPYGVVIGPGQILGRIIDPSGQVLPGAQVTITAPNGVQRTAITREDGSYIALDVPSGRLSVRAELAGFRTAERSFVFDQRPRQVDFQLQLGALTETVEVAAEAPLVDMKSSERSEDALRLTPENQNERVNTRTAPKQVPQQQAPSPSILSLQRRVSGVLPVRIDVPRTGALHRFVRPLVLGEETTVTFKYKKR